MVRYRLLTFNIAHGRGALPVHQGLRSEARIRSNLLKIARLIQRLGVDIVALQEIDENSRWNGSFDHLAFLSAHSGLAHAVHGVNNRRTGRYHLNYGNAVLSRFPIVHSETTPFGYGKLGELALCSRKSPCPGRASCRWSTCTCTTARARSGSSRPAGSSTIWRSSGRAVPPTGISR